MTDDDPTIRQLTDEERMSHFDDFPPGTPPIEHRLDARIGRLERDNEGLRRDVASLVASRDTNRKIMWLVIPLLVTALGTEFHYSSDKIASSSERAGRVEATLDALKEEHKQDREEITQLRGVMLKLVGVDPKPVTIVRAP